jgi:hypothetical protein
MEPLMLSASRYLLSIVVLFAGFIALCAIGYEEFIAEDAYRPIRVNDVVVEDPVFIGEQAVLRNGVCNVTDDLVRVEVWLAAQPHAEGGITPPAIDLIGTQELGAAIDLIGTQELGAPEDIDPDTCEGEMITATVPEELPPGRWELIGRVVARGSQADRPGENQVINIRSNTFEVRRRLER